MNLLDSPWFLQLVEKQSKAPADRLVAVFRVIGLWISAPGVRELLLQQYGGERYSLRGHDHLRRFLSDTAISARATNPATLTNQLVILLQGAIAEELRNPEAQAMQGAIQAAQAVVLTTCRSRRVWQRYALFAGAAAASLLAGVLILPLQVQPDAALARLASAPATPAPPRASPHISPDTISAVLLLRSRLEQGICPSPQLLAMTQDQLAAYQEIVSLHFADNANVDWNNMHAFMDWYANALSTECYMAPANGHTTVAWVTSQDNAR